MSVIAQRVDRAELEQVREFVTRFHGEFEHDFAIRDLVSPAVYQKML